MDQQKPISYLSLKCIIPYMNVNFRTIHASHFPSLRNIQKSLPLRFDVLKLDNSSFTLDTTTHSFYTILDSPEKHQPSPATLKNARHEGKLYDVNENGLEDRKDFLMPGDIVIRSRRLPIIGDGTFFSQPQAVKYKSFVYYCVESSKNNIRQAAYSPYGVKLRDAIRKKLNDFLGGKKIHKVKHLEIGMSGGILRLPEGLKLKIRELSVQINGNAVIDRILPVLDASSFPLKSLSIDVKRSEDPVFKNEILKNCETLNIKIKSIPRWADLLISLSNKNINFKQYILVNDFVSLAKHWVEYPRIIGTRFSMQSSSVKNYLKLLQNELNAAEAVISERRCSFFSLCYTLPMNTTSELNFYGVKSPNHEEELTTRHPQTYMVVMEVMSIGSAQQRQLY